ncbi:MAG TPA: FkbM family methyltransferase [Paracoccaceae bacterium]|nr:FkbM family methyltransferase [Paracoccaceae bacterium]
MNWRYIVGAGLARATHAALRRAPPVRYVPYGRYWLYDLHRFCGRSLGPIFDVGANVGQTARGLVRYFPDDPIYCFEPVESSFEVLQRDYADRVTAVRSALGSVPGTGEMHLHTDSELDTLAAPGDLAASLSTGDSVTVPIDTVDGFAARHGIERIGLLKMDVQGWELEVLRGADRMLGSGAIAAVFSEVAFDTGRPDMQDFCQLNEHLSLKGFTFCGLYDQFRWGDKKKVHFANALYLRLDREVAS